MRPIEKLRVNRNRAPASELEMVVEVILFVGEFEFVQLIPRNYPADGCIVFGLSFADAAWMFAIVK